MPSIVANHLTSGLLKYIHTTGRYTSGINLFEKLRTRESEVSSLLARILLSADEEVQAVTLLHDAIGELSMDYALLDCQSSFCESKGRLEWALECAKRSVTAAPSEFITWARLAEVYVAMEQWDLALLTLNSCPMFTYQDRDAPRMPEPARVLLPVLPESMLDEIDESQNGYDSEMTSPALRRLRAANHKGTFSKAYSLLTEVVAKIGWDQLLKLRSQVFVMEEEYRTEKQAPQPRSPNPNASTTALHSPSPQLNGEAAGANRMNGNTDDQESDIEGHQGEPGSPISEAETPLERPNHTVTAEEVKSAARDEVSDTSFVLVGTANFCRSINTSKIKRTSCATSACASDGSITSSWTRTKTSGFTPCGERI